MQKTPGKPTKTASTPTKTASTPTETASTPNIDLRGFVARQFFAANLLTFLVYNLQAKKCVGLQKMTNIRYDLGFANVWSGLDQILNLIYKLSWEWEWVMLNDIVQVHLKHGNAVDNQPVSWYDFTTLSTDISAALEPKLCLPSSSN